MDPRRAHLKELAARSAGLWATAPTPDSLAGETGLQTRNSVYRLHDGVVIALERTGSGRSSRVHAGAFLGMRVVGWISGDGQGQELTADYRPGAHAILWRPRSTAGDRTAVALTSATTGLRRFERATPPPSGVRSIAGVRGATPPRPPAPSRVSTPPPPLESTTRLHDADAPAAARPSRPPTLPTCARMTLLPPSARAS